MEWAKDGEAEEPARVAGTSAAGREGTRRSEKAKVSEEALLTRGSKAKKPMNACVHTTSPHASPSTQTLSAHNKHKSEGFIAIVQDLVKINLIK